MKFIDFACIAWLTIDVGTFILWLLTGIMLMHDPGETVDGGARMGIALLHIALFLFSIAWVAFRKDNDELFK